MPVTIDRTVIRAMNPKPGDWDSMVLCEVNHDIGTRNVAPSVPQGCDLYPTIDATSGDEQPGKPRLQYALRQRALDLGWDERQH